MFPGPATQSLVVKELATNSVRFAEKLLSTLSQSSQRELQSVLATGGRLDTPFRRKVSRKPAPLTTRSDVRARRRKHIASVF